MFTLADRWLAPTPREKTRPAHQRDVFLACTDWPVGTASAWVLFTTLILQQQPASSTSSLRFSHDSIPSHTIISTPPTALCCCPLCTQRLMMPSAGGMCLTVLQRREREERRGEEEDTTPPRSTGTTWRAGMALAPSARGCVRPSLSRCGHRAMVLCV